MLPQGLSPLRSVGNIVQRLVSQQFLAQEFNGCPRHIARVYDTITHTLYQQYIFRY